jgi:XTP/dITP diphosphohydrolase
MSYQMRFPCVLATQNLHKVEEIAPFLDQRLKWLTLSEGGWTGGKLVENETTFEGNAQSKALQGFEGTGLPTLADDSGLVVPFLQGAPGVLSARYAGPDASDAENRQKLLTELGGQVVPAYFVCVLAWVHQGIRVQVRGEVHGTIAASERGSAGFGYDALFVPTEGDGRTFAEMHPSEKQRISHRAKALEQFNRIALSDLGLF